jgi:DNA (cytosine-5)-methyltransferase 1
MSLRVGSVFTGIGGIDLGFERAGWEVAWQCEFNPWCQRVLLKHWPRVRLYDDVKELVRRVERGELPEQVDLLTGGFPCQDISLAGGRAGLAGNRSGLYFPFMELVAALRPEFVLVENVTGLLSSNGTEDLGAVLGTLEELGYGWAYRTLNSRYFGVAQRRRRVFVVGCAGGSVRRAAEVLFESDGLPWDPLAGSEAREGVASSAPSRSGGGRVSRALTAHPGPRYDGESDTFVVEEEPIGVTFNGPKAWSDPAEVGVSQTLAGMDSGDRMPMVAHPVSMRWREGKPGGGKGALLSDDRALTLAASDDQMLFQPQGFQQNQREEVIMSDQASSLTTGGGKPGQGYAAVMDGFVVRRFTPLECERLQGFPEGWTKFDPDGRSIRDDERARMLGNAVTVPVAEWIGKRMREVLERA